MLEYLYYVNAGPDVPARTDATGPLANVNASAGQTDLTAQRLGALELAVETLARLGIEKGMFTEEEFLKVAQQIDAEDGIMDGRRDLTKMKKICSTCGKPNTATKVLCMWCGADLVAVQPEANLL